MTDATGNIVNTYDYTPFGSVYANNTVEAVKQRYQYTGREKNAVSDTMYYRYRTYAPGTGRFVQRDPIGYGGGINLYWYVGNQSNRYSDPFGLYSTDKATCCSIDDDIAKNKEVQDKLEDMWQKWQVGEGWSDYELEPFSNAAGGRSEAYKNASKGIQEITDEIEGNLGVNSMQALQLTVIGGHYYWNPITWLYTNSNDRQTQWWLTRIAIERGRSKWFGAEQEKLRSQCKEEFGDGKDKCFDKWLEDECSK